MSRLLITSVLTLFLFNCSYAKSFATDEVLDTIVMSGDDFYFVALNHLKAEDWNQAIKYFELAIEEGSERENINTELALAYSQVGNYKKAKLNCYRAISNNPQAEIAHLYMATILGLEEELDSSSVYYERLININSKNPSGYFGLANVRTLQEDYDAALIYAREALELFEKGGSSRVGDAQYLVGVLHYYKQEDQKAKEFLELAKKNGIELEEHLEVFLREMNEKIILETPEDFEKYEKEVTTALAYLLSNPADGEIGIRTGKCQFIIEWVSGAPNIRVTVTNKLVPYMEYGESLVIYIGAWADYCIQGGECDEKIKGCLAATQAVISYYESNKAVLGKNKELEKMAKRMKKNKLEKYLSEHLQ